MNILPTKAKKFAQRKGGAGWNQHVNKYVKRVANKVMRRRAKDEQAERDTAMNDAHDNEQTDKAMLARYTAQREIIQPDWRQCVACGKTGSHTCYDRPTHKVDMLDAIMDEIEAERELPPMSCGGKGTCCDDDWSACGCSCHA